MRALGIDPGAKRLGYATVSRLTDGQYVLEDSGYVLIEQGADEKWAAYRRRLISYWVMSFESFFWVDIDTVAFEQQPPFGMSGVQQQLAKTVRDTCQTICEMNEHHWAEYAPVTVKKNVTGNGRATKVGVRNGVTAVFPELASRKKELTTVSEESDAIAIALVGLGYKFGTATTP